MAAVGGMMIAALTMACGDGEYLVFPANKGLVINEIKANIPEDAHVKQYVELRGTPGKTLKHMYLITVDGDENGDEDKPFEDWGYIDYACSLDGVTVGENGLVLIKNPDEYNTAEAAGTSLVNDSVIRTYDEDVDGKAFADGIIEHDAMTFLLVQSLTPITMGSDLDADNDGTLELPENAVVLDAVGWEAGGRAYTDVLLAQSASDPDAATRFYDDLTPSSASAWANGDVYEDPDKDDGDLPDELLYDTLQASSNLPPKAALTPGGHNFKQAPFVLLNEIVTVDEPYIELLSNAAQAMDHIYLVVLDSGSGGMPSLAMDLTSVQAKETGLTLVHETDSTLTVGSSITEVTGDLSSLKALDMSVLLVYCPGSAIDLATDLDGDDDGVMDLPEHAVLLDNMGWGAPCYSDMCVDEGYAIHAATRFKDNKMVALNAWTYGELDGDIYSDTASRNTPAGGAVTPARTNFPETAAMLVAPVIETARTTMDNPDADDVAIWIHPDDPGKSLIIGTQKEAGYSVYDVDGKTLVDVNPGNIRFNNVDVMYGFDFNGTPVDLAVFTDRVTNMFAIYTIQDSAPYIVDVTDYLDSEELFDAAATGEDTAYGEGVYKSPETGTFYAFATRNDTWECAQFELLARTDTIGWTKVRTITLEADDDDKHAEGFVVDQEYGKAYVAQEEVGIYTFDAEPGSGVDLVLTEDDLLMEEGDHGLVEDLEGMTIYYKDNGDGYVFISSQGNNTFGVFDRAPVGTDNRFIRSFAIVDDTYGIDGVQETDSIDVTNIPFGIFDYGAFMVQDGLDTSSDPDDIETNFKWLKWEDIAEGLGDTSFSSSYDPRAPVNRRSQH